ncbi:hypothetical protein [Desulfotomaculum copahuensis]|nr:hypothetical protein [Desulfotomaculum copahuensis]
MPEYESADVKTRAFTGIEFALGVVIAILGFLVLVGGVLVAIF